LLKASAETMLSHLTKKKMRRKIPEEPARRGSHKFPILCLDGPTEKCECAIRHKKSARSRNIRKSWQHFEHSQTAMARTVQFSTKHA
jgi:hypothetical protein